MGLRFFKLFSGDESKVVNVNTADTARTTSTVVAATQNVDATGKVPPAGEAVGNAPFVKITDGTDTASVTRFGLGVDVRNKYTEIIDLYLHQHIQSLTLNAGVSIDDTSVVVDSAAEVTDGYIVCFKEGSAFYQGAILSHSSAGGSLWTVNLDTPFDFAFTTGATCSEGNTNLAVDGSVTPVEFKVSPSGLTAGIEWDITRMMGSITDGTVMDDAKFGGITALTKGVVFRVVDGTTKNIFNAKSNADIKAHSFDLTYADKAPAGSYGLTFRRAFGGLDKNGSVIRLAATSDDEFVCIVQDDLTGLTTFHVVAQGHVVE